MSIVEYKQTAPPTQLNIFIIGMCIVWLETKESMGAAIILRLSQLCKKARFTVKSRWLMMKQLNDIISNLEQQRVARFMK